ALREGYLQGGRVRRADDYAKEIDRGVGVAKLARRLGRDRVVAGDRREERDGLLLALHRALVIRERELHAREAVEGVRILWIGRDRAAHSLVRGVAGTRLVLPRELQLHPSKVPPERRRVGRPRRGLAIRDTRTSQVRDELERAAKVVPVHGASGIDGRRGPRQIDGARGVRTERRLGAFRGTIRLKAAELSERDGREADDDQEPEERGQTQWRDRRHYASPSQLARQGDPDAYPRDTTSA